MRITIAYFAVSLASAALDSEAERKCSEVYQGFYSAMIGTSKVVSITIDGGANEFVVDVTELAPAESGKALNPFEWTFNTPIAFKLEPDCNITIANESFPTYVAVMDELSKLGGINYTNASINSTSYKSEAIYDPEQFAINFGTLTLVADDDTTSPKPIITAKSQVNVGHYMNQLIGGIVMVVRVIDESRMALTVNVPVELPADRSRIVRTLVDYSISGDQIKINANERTVYMNLAFTEMLLQTLGDIDLSPEFSFTYCEESKVLKVGNVSLKLDEAIVKVEADNKPEDAKTDEQVQL